MSETRKLFESFQSNLNEANYKKVDVNTLKNELEAELKNYMTEPERGFDVEKNPEDRYNSYYGDYSNIEINPNIDDDFVIRANAELGYESLMGLAERLDKIVKKYDPEAYFDAEDSGRLICIMNSNSIKGELQESNTNESNLDKVRKDSIEKGLLTEDISDNIQLYMNTWGNYNENGADVDSIGGGWMDIEQAKEFLEKHSDEEPFINDTNDCPIEVSEYDNPWEVIEHLEKIEELDNIDAFLAILEEDNDNFDEALDIYESGDYVFFAGVDNDEDLGRAYVDMVGGLEGVANLEYYIDEDAYRESWRDAAESAARESDPDLDEDSDEFNQVVEQWLDSIAPEELQNDIDEGRDLTEYFDYEALGYDLYSDGYYYADTGAIYTM